jgi:hypothetical protein
VAFAQIVVNDGLVVVLDELFNNHTADITGATGNQNLHEISF